jgi:homoserine kinase type II
MAQGGELSDGQLSRALALYGLVPRTCSRIDGGATNSSYLVDCTTGVRVVVTGLDDTLGLPSDTLARFLRYLGKHSVSTGEPIESRNGALVETLDGRRLMVKRFVAGVCHDVLPLEVLATAGRALARVHAVGVPDWLPRASRRLSAIARDLARFDDREFADWIVSRLDETAVLFDTTDPYRIVHGDYFADNLIVEPAGGIAILDWETASTDLAVLDLGFAVVGLCRTESELDVARLRPLLGGYSSVRALSGAEASHLRDAVIYAATFLGHRRYARYHIHHPDAAKQHRYREMPVFVDSVRSRWPAAWNPSRAAFIQDGERPLL